MDREGRSEQMETRESKKTSKKANRSHINGTKDLVKMKGRPVVNEVSEEEAMKMKLDSSIRQMSRLYMNSYTTSL